jgi:mRNA interferase RelE/StbE
VKSIAFTAAAAKDLDGLPEADREQVHNALCNYAVTGQGDVKRLTGRSEYRL